jgi:hypothetical protein
MLTKQVPIQNIQELHERFRMAQVLLLVYRSHIQRIKRHPVGFCHLPPAVRTQIAQMTHGRPSMRTVPRLVHPRKVPNHLHKPSIACSQYAQSTYVDHVPVLERGTDHNRAPTGSHREHGPRLGASHRLAWVAFFHLVQDFFEI